MATNIIIYPSGTTSNTNPHIVFKGDAGQIQLNVIATPGDAALQLSSSTVSSGTILDPSTGITSSGFTITTGDVQVGGLSAVSTGGFWKGNLANIKGAQGSQGNQGFKGVKGDTGNAGFKGDNGAQGTVGPTGNVGPTGFAGAQGNQGPQGFRGPIGPQGPPSDERLKTEIQSLKGNYSKIDELRGVTFEWNKEYIENTFKGTEREIEFDKNNYYKQRSLGFIAQELEKSVPEVVWTSEDGHKTVEYNIMVSIAIGAVKEQQSRINHIYEKINNLKQLVSG